MTRDRHVGIGTASPGVKLHVQGVNQDVHILAKTNDNNVAVLAAHGDSQGTGRLYVGQSNTYGGGIEYNGDNSPTSTGAGADYLALYSRQWRVPLDGEKLLQQQLVVQKSHWYRGVEPIVSTPHR